MPKQVRRYVSRNAFTAKKAGNYLQGLQSEPETSGYRL